MAVVSMIIYLIRILIIGIATGTLFIRCSLFNKMNNGQIILLGVGSTPMIVSLFDYLLGLIFIGWSSWLFVLFPVGLAIIFLILKGNLKIAKEAICEVGSFCFETVRTLKEWIFLDIFVSSCFVLTFVFMYNDPSTIVVLGSSLLHDFNMPGRIIEVIFAIALLAMIIHFARRMNADGTLMKNLFLVLSLVVISNSLFFGISFNRRPTLDSDRSHYELNARYFLQDKNSWEVDNYKDEKYGSSLRDDHGPLWIMDLADAKLVADACGLKDTLRTTNFAIFWTDCCFTLLFFLGAFLVAKTYKAGVVALLLFDLYKYEVMMILGSRDAFRFVGLLLLFIFVCNMFDEIVQNKVKCRQYIFMLLFCYFSMNGHESNVYVMLGMFVVMGIMLLIEKTHVKQLIFFAISVLAGTVLGISKTISLYITTGNLTSSTKLPFHDTPVIDQLIEINNAKADWITIWSSYSNAVIFVMVLGIISLITMLVASIQKKDKETLVYALLVLGMLLPMTGAMDWLGYECSRWFFAQYRYRMYFLMLLSMTGAWLLTRDYCLKILSVGTGIIVLLLFGLYGYAEYEKLLTYNKDYISSCEVTCEDYKQLAEYIDKITDKNVFTQDQVLLYYLHNTPRLLYHIYTEPLIQAKTDEEIAAALDELNVGVILLPENGLEYHDYSLLPFWKYINENENFVKIKPEFGQWIVFYNNT